MNNFKQIKLTLRFIKFDDFSAHSSIPIHGIGENISLAILGLRNLVRNPANYSRLSRRREGALYFKQAEL